MANALSPAEWKKILKDHKDAPDTAPLTKALDAYATAESKVKDVPQPVLDALAKVVDATRSARSANARDKKRKPVVDFLDDVLKDAAVMKVKVERFLQEKNERDREGPDEDEGGDDERAKLTERLVKVKKLEVADAKPFVLALGKKSHGLVIAKTAALSGDHKKRARAMREGSGKVFTGLVYGEGGKYVFQMEEIPPKGLAKAIKKTAKMHTDMLIRVILRGPDGFELDDENDVEEMADLGTDTEETAEGATPSANGTQTATSDEEKARFSAKVKELTPRIKEALLARGPFAAEIDSLRAEMWDLGTKTQYVEALEVLARLETLLDRAPAPGEAEGPGAETLRRIAALSPRVKERLAAKAPSAREIGLAFSEAQALARQGNFEEAGTKLDEVENALDGKTATATPTVAGTPRATEAKWGKALAAIESDYFQALSDRPADASNLRAVMGFAQGKAETEDFDGAIAALKKLKEQLVGKATVPTGEVSNGPVAPSPTDASPARGLVEKRKFLLERWQRIPQEVRADLRKLKQAIEREMPGEDADLLIELSEDYLDEFYNEMKEAIDADINSGDAQYKDAISTIGAFRSKIAGEPLIQHLKTNTLKADVTIESILLDALAEVEHALAS